MPITDNTVLFGKTVSWVINFCSNNPFPGNNKYPASHPIWTSWVGSGVSPLTAWYDQKLLTKAVKNLFYITLSSLSSGKYPEFVKRIKKAFDGAGRDLLIEVLLRFTIAKIAPKVTALQPTTMLRILDASGIDISSGVYAPMAGFGGIIKACETWGRQHKVNIEVEPYDINQAFCDYYGWGKRDLLAQKIITDKVCVVCPPFGEEHEHWEGSDDCYFGFEAWAQKIISGDYIQAKDYILIGPEDRGGTPNRYASGVKPSGLFAKKVGIKWYPEYSRATQPNQKFEWEIQASSTPTA